MPFSSANLTALIQGNNFTLWQYRTGDSRAAVTAAGYFAAVAGSLRAGDLMVLQTADAMALLPIRSGPALGTGVTLDGAVGPLNTVRAVAQGFRFGQAAAAVVRTIILAPFAAGIVAGTSIPVSASVIGPISQVVFSLRDASGAVVPPVQVVPVVGGAAAASFAAPPIGTGYRIRVEDAADPALAALSRSFNVGADLKLVLLESDGRLLSESGAVLKQ
ncbi:hypothetical protein JMJ55_25100 [Belnapia sp. T6]|uniref:Uncharacterized protein n=1 Tax=Belnapia mucosa TaxID=2804532 RepID=A0ABS1VAB1_9PROT|nr:hypothetical protein [Belnapia mucosa]MBL6458621.1 hypothetical protein [Belnapia mucosa]